MEKLIIQNGTNQDDVALFNESLSDLQKEEVRKKIAEEAHKSLKIETNSIGASIEASMIIDGNVNYLRLALESVLGGTVYELELQLQIEKRIFQEDTEKFKILLQCCIRIRESSQFFENVEDSSWIRNRIHSGKYAAITHAIEVLSSLGFLSEEESIEYARIQSMNEIIDKDVSDSYKKTLLGFIEHLPKNILSSHSFSPEMCAAIGYIPSIKVLEKDLPDTTNIANFN